MADIGSVVGSILMRDQFSQVFDKFNRDLDTSAQKVLKTGRQMSSAGIALTKAITLPIVAIGGLSVKAFSTFDDAMNQSLAIMGDVSDSMREDMADAARELPLVVRASAAESAAGFEFLARAGKNAEQALSLLPIAARFANAGVVDLALGTDLLTDAQSALGLSSKNVQQDHRNMVRVSDVLVKANTVANASVVQFSKSLTTKAGDAMRRWGQDVESGVAILAAWADQGVKAELAGTRYGIVIRDLTGKALKNADAFKKQNIAVFDQTGAMRPLVDIIEDMEVAFEGMSDETRKATLMQLGFTFKSEAATSSLIGLSEKIRGYEADLRNAGGVTQEVSDNQMKSFAAVMGVVKNRIVDVGIELGSKLAPIITSTVLPVVVAITNAVRRVVDQFGALPTGVQTAIVAIAALVAGIGPLLVVAGALVTAFGFVASALGGPAIAAILSITAAFTAMGVVVFNLAKRFQPVVVEIRKFWAETEVTRKFLVNLVRVIANDLVQGIRSIVASIKAAIVFFFQWTGISKFLEKQLSDVNGVINKSSALLKTSLGFYKLFVKGLIDTVKNVKSFKASLLGVVAVMSLVSPSVALAADKIDDWAERANAAVEESIALEDAAIDLARETEFLTTSVEGMDKAYVEASAEWDKASKKTKVLAGEEKNLAAIQDIVTESTDRMRDANKNFGLVTKEIVVQVRALGLEISNLPVAELELDIDDTAFRDMADNMSFAEAAAFTVWEQIEAISDAETRVVEQAFAQLDIQQQINQLFADGTIDKALKKQLESANGIVSKWAELPGVLSDVFDNMDSKMGDIGGSLLGIVESFRELNASGGKGTAGFASGLAGIAGGVDALGEAMGLFKGPGGTSSFSGKMSGDMSKEGGEVGEVIGAVIGTMFFGIGGVAGAAIGKTLGKIVGSMIKTGADTAEATVKQVADDLSVQVTKEEGPLGRPIRALAEGVRDAFSTLEAIIGGEVGIADFDIKIREEVVTAWVNGVKAKFDNIGDAIDFIVTESIRTAEFGEGVSSRFITALQNTNLQTVEELEELLQTVSEIEAIASDSGVVAQGFKVLGIEMKILEGVIAEAGLDAADAVLVQAHKVGLMRDAITDTAAGIVGVSDTAGGFQDFVKSAQEFNDGLDAITASREAELAAALEADVALTNMNALIAELPPGVSRVDEGLGVMKDGLKGFNIGLRGASESAIAARIDVDTFGDALAGMPDRIDMDEIRDAAAVAAKGVGVTLIDMIESVRGSGTLSTQRMKLEKDAFMVQLAAQIVQMQLFAAMTDLFTQSTQNMLQGLVDDGLSLLDDLESGTATIGDQANKAASGRGKARREAEKDFNKSAAEVTAMLAGATSASFTFADSVQALRDKAKAGKVGIAALDQAISNMAELDLNGIATDWELISDNIRRSEIGNAFSEILTTARASIDEVMARIEANSEASRAALGSIHRGVRDQLSVLGQESLLELAGGITNLRAEGHETVRNIRFLSTHLDQLGITAGQLARSVKEGIIPGLLDVGIEQAKRLGLDQEVARFEAMQAEIQRKFTLVQLQVWRVMIETAGAMDATTAKLFDDITALVNLDLPPIDVPPIDTSGVEAGTEIVEDAWVDTSAAVIESTNAMTESFTGLLAQFDNINERFVTVSARTVTLTSEMSALEPVLFTVQKRVHRLARELGKFPDSKSRDVPGFAHGSNQFVEFGSGTLIETHGKEEIVTEAQGNSLADMVKGAIQGGKGGSDTQFMGAFLSRDDARSEREENTAQLLRELLRHLEGGEDRKSVSGQGIGDPL